MRPSGPVPQWATDVLYPAGAAAWNNQVTKVDPGTSVKAEGFEPAKRYPAQFFNWLQNLYGKFHLAYDAFPVQNWRIDPAALPFTAGFDMLWVEAEQRLYVVGTNSAATVAYSIDGGRTWTNDTASLAAAGTQITAADVNTATGFWIGVQGTDNRLHAHAAGGVYTSATLASATTFNRPVYNPYDVSGNPIAIGGKDSTNHPAIWKTLTSLAPTAMTLTNQATYTGTVTMMAHGPTRSVAIAAVTAPSVQKRFWDTPNFGTNWTDRGVVPSSGGSIPVELAYGATDGIFMMLHDTGRVYVSSDGINWTDKGIPTGFTFPNGTGQSLAAYGSIWLTQAVYATVKVLAYSVDQGTTWTTVAQPVNATAAPACIRALKGMFGMSQLTKTAFSVRAV